MAATAAATSTVVAVCGRSLQDQRDHRRHLERGLDLAPRRRGDRQGWLTAISRRPVTANSRAMITIATQVRKPVEADQRDQRRRDQQLVRQRVEQRADRRDVVPGARQVAVQRVGRRRDREDDHGKGIAAGHGAQQRDHEHRDQQDAEERDPVGKRHGRRTGYSNAHARSGFGATARRPPARRSRSRSCSRTPRSSSCREADRGGGPGDGGADGTTSRPRSRAQTITSGS